jgi:7,8-dihydropterin-6-yl-methyl-4-(beta-D-ribofuranosyl)aminobenzene 5'-phosphate synthase
MKIVVLTENLTFTDEHFFGEPGPSYWIEADGKHILFDTGFSDLYIKNAKKLHVDLSKTDAIVLSHGHNDHATGIKYFPKPSKKIPLITHPNCFIPKWKDTTYIGASITSEEAEQNFAYVPSIKPYFITPNIAFLGEIPRVHEFEPSTQVGHLKIGDKTQPDYLIDDTAMAVKTSSGVVVITGCSHSGVCNIIDQAKSVFHTKTISAILGGFHLRSASDERIEKTTAFFEKNVTGTVYGGHCTGFKAKYLLNTKLHVEEPYVGETIELSV